MDLLVRIKHWWDGLFRRRRLSLLNTRDNQEVWYTHISPMNIIMAFVSTVALLFIVILTLVGYTPILDTLPGYSAEVHRSRQLLIDNIIKLDSMERVIDEMVLYTDNVSLIMDGKTPVVRAKTSTDSTPISKELLPPNSADSALRREMQGKGRYNIRAAAAISDTNLITPISGAITQHFNLEQKSFGVVISSSPQQKIVAVQDGIAILVLENGKSGYTIEILHNNNIISIYQNVHHATINRGDVVKSGDIIGSNSKRSSNKAHQIGFELWRDGAAVDPERYIIF